MRLMAVYKFSFYIDDDNYQRMSEDKLQDICDIIEEEMEKLEVEGILSNKFQELELPITVKLED